MYLKELSRHGLLKLRDNSRSIVCQEPKQYDALSYIALYELTVTFA